MAALQADISRSVDGAVAVDSGLVTDVVLVEANNKSCPTMYPVTYLNGDTPVQSLLYYSMTSYMSIETTIAVSGSMVILQP
jgi:hypothetical protein